MSESDADTQPHSDDDTGADIGADSVLWTAADQADVEYRSGSK